MNYEENQLASIKKNLNLTQIKSS